MLIESNLEWIIPTDNKVVSSSRNDARGGRVSRKTSTLMQTLIWQHIGLLIRRPLKILIIIYWIYADQYSEGMKKDQQVNGEKLRSRLLVYNEQRWPLKQCKNNNNIRLTRYLRISISGSTSSSYMYKCSVSVRRQRSKRKMRCSPSAHGRNPNVHRCYPTILHWITKHILALSPVYLIYSRWTYLLPYPGARAWPSHPCRAREPSHARRAQRRHRRGEWTRCARCSRHERRQCAAFLFYG